MINKTTVISCMLAILLMGLLSVVLARTMGLKVTNTAS